MNNLYSKNNKGFTIIETLIAITILMISIAGPLTIAQKSLNAATYAKDQVTASFLAQEQMEKIKNDRDNKRLVGVTLFNWVNTSLTIESQRPYCVPGNGQGNDCTMKIVQIGNNAGTYIDQNGNGNPSKFKRYAEVKMGTSGVDAKVVVTVIWNTGTIVNTVTLEDRLFDITL